MATKPTAKVSQRAHSAAGPPARARGQVWGADVGAELGSRVGTALGAAAEATGPLVERLQDSAPGLTAAAGRTGSSIVELTERAREGAGPALANLTERAGPTGAAVAEALGDARLRGSAAWDVLRGERVGPPVAVRRWPWAVGAAVAGAALGGVVAYLLGRVSPTDPPGAQEPHEVRAVVDRPPGATISDAAASGS